MVIRAWQKGTCLGMTSRLTLAAFLSTSLACSGIFDPEAFREQGEAAMAEGRAHGATTDQEGCVRDGLTRQLACGELEVMCQAMAALWGQACMESAAPVEGFCAGVPPTSEIMASSQWRIEQCDAQGHSGNTQCAQFFSAVQEHCHD